MPSLSSQHVNTKLSHRLPELLVSGFIFTAGAVFWGQHLAPKPDEAPEMDSAISARDASDTFKADTPPMGWEPAPASERKAAQKLIIAQLEAFKSNAWTQALSYQTQYLQRKFATPQQFRQMMARRYPQFTAYQSVSFGVARYDGTYLQMDVSLIGKDGTNVEGTYILAKEYGTYRVDGVNCSQAPRQGPSS